MRDPMPAAPIRTPDHRLRVFISSTLGELAPERAAVRSAIEALHLAPVMFELGARPHAARALYRAYLAQSHIFIGLYWQRYGWTPPGDSVSGLEDEYRLSAGLPRLLYIKEPSPEREDRLARLLTEIRDVEPVSYKRFRSLDELSDLVTRDLALLLAERFEASAEDGHEPPGRRAASVPRPLTRLLGREQELDRVVELLRGGHRLVSLTGPGGVGKTRLSLEAARRLEGAFRDGVYFVPLAAVQEAGQFDRAVVDCLGLRAEGSWTPRDALVDHLAGRDVLLVLDNLEQIAGIEAQVRELLELLPRVAVLTTSRRALRIAGEQVVVVPTLPAPAPVPQTDLTVQPAVALFVERAREADPSFDLGPDAMAVAEICRRVDGLPLAIELAAARTRVLSPAALLARLEEGLGVLRGGTPGLPERQQTLRATLEWSYGLLGPAEQALLARVSVFSGSFTLDAAEGVCDLDGEVDVLESLTALLDNSLVRIAAQPGGPEPRFALLETVRSFAASALAERGETEAIGRRHLAWYRRMAERAQPFLCGPNQREWSAKMDPERDNLRAACSAALEQGDLEAVVEIVWDLAVFYEIRDASDETRAWIQAVTSRAPDFDEVLRAKLRSIDALLRVQTGMYAGAQEDLDAALEVFRVQEMAFEAAVTLMVLADVHFTVNLDSATAMGAIEESIRLFEAVEHDWGVARTEIMLATMLWGLDDIEGAEAHLHRSLSRSRRIENEPQIARALSLLAMLARGRRPLLEVGGLLREAGSIVVRGRYRTEATVLLDALAGSLVDRGEPTAAAEASRMSEHVRRSLGLSLAPALRRFGARLPGTRVEATGAEASEASAEPGEQRQPDDVFDVVSRALALASGA